MVDQIYCYPPDFSVLKNKLDIRDSIHLDKTERGYVQTRIFEGCPVGQFDAAHVKTIHQYLFKKIYEWVGIYRTVEIRKGGHWFHSHQFIEQGMGEVERIIQAGKFGKGMNIDQFGDYASEVIGNLNYVHPFREGNGRTQMEFLRQLSEQAGYELNTEKIQRDVWITASHISHSGTNNLLKAAIKYAIDPEQTQTGDKACSAVRDYLETVSSSVLSLQNSQEKQTGLSQIEKIAKIYEMMMDDETKAKFLPEQTRIEETIPEDDGTTP